MQERVFVTGIGAITGIGKNTSEIFNSLLSEQSGIGSISFLDTIHKDEIPICEVKAMNDELHELAKTSIKSGFTRTALLGMIAAKEALTNSCIQNLSEKRTGLISATTVGGMDKTEQHFKDFINSNKYNDFVCSHDSGDSTEKIADYLGIKDYVSTLSTACSASANAIIFGTQLIKHGILDRAIVGGTDALTKFTLNGFNTLLILTKEKCRPFDQNRSGLALGEGAGYLVLESKKSIEDENKTIICEITGYGNACDAYHQTATSPNGYGPYLAMQKAIEMSGLNPNQIQYINAHGTGTPNNDLTEGKAIERIFSRNIPYVSSTKGYTGHLLGAAGSVEAIISCLTLKENIIFPNLNFIEPIKDLSFSPTNRIINNVEVENIMSNSIGFGGNNSSLIFSRC